MGYIQLTFRCLLSAILLFISCLSFAQVTHPITDRAIVLYQEGDLMAARDAVLEAVQSAEEKEPLMHGL